MDRLRTRTAAAGLAATLLLSASTASAGWTTGPLTAEIHRGLWFFVPADLNGLSFDGLLDTGAGVTLLDAAVAEKLGLDLAPGGTVMGAGGERPFRWAQDLTLQVGRARLRGLRAAVLDLQELTAPMGRAVPLIIGADLFRSLVIEMDPARGTVTFSSPDGWRYRGAGRRTRIHPTDDGMIAIDARIEGLPSGLVTLDTGASGAIDVFSPVVRSFELLEERTQTTSLGGGIGGAHAVPLASLETMRLGPFDFTRVPAELHADDDVQLWAQGGLLGNIGMSMLRRFRMTFVQPRRVMYLEPIAEVDQAAFRRNRVGLQVLRGEDSLEVLHVMPGSPAAEQGWSVGDRIVAVDGRPVSQSSLATFSDHAGEPGTEIRLRLDTGGERVLVLRDFY